MKKHISYLAVSLMAGFLLLAGCSDSGNDNGLTVNSPCKSDDECQTDLCWNQICSHKNPNGNGGDCFGKGECRSQNCAGGACVGGVKKAAEACRFNEECKSNYCVLSKCAAVTKQDGGLDVGAPDLKPDAPVPDLPPLDISKPDLAKDLGKQDGGCTTNTDCYDGKACTTGKCTTGKCVYTLKSTWCLINGSCMGNGGFNPKNSCLKCDPTKSTTKWSYNNGQTCSDKNLCTWSDTCAAGVCKGTKYVCNDGLACTTETCTGSGPGPNGCQATLVSGYCLVGITCYKDKTVSPSNQCHKCATNYPHAWTPVVGKGCVTTFAGDGTQGSTDGTAIASSFNAPKGLDIDSLGNIYIADSGNSSIRLITQKTVAGKLSITVSTLVGKVGKGFHDGASTLAKMSDLSDLAVDKKGFVYVADTGNNRIRVVNNGLVTTLAGSGLKGLLDGPDLSAKFDTPTGIAVNSGGSTVWVADMANKVLRKIIVAGGKVSTLPAANVAAGLMSPFDVETDGTDLYFTDTTMNKVFKVSGGVLSLFAGTGTGGYLNGSALNAQFKSPLGLAIGGKQIFVGDSDNNRIRLIKGGQVTNFAGDGTASKRDDVAAKAWLNGPTDMVIAPSGKIYISDTDNDVIRLYTP